MKKTLYLIFVLALLTDIIYAQNEKKLVILHTNDIHSRLIGYWPETAYTPLSVNDDKTIGGFARIATILKNERQKSDDITLTVDAGDFLMGTLFQDLEPSTGFQLRLMKKMGYDVVCLGNHEFDYGPSKLADIINSGIAKGGIPPVLLSNAEFDSDDPADDSLEGVFKSGGIRRTWILERGGLKIGFFSLFGKSADENAAFASPVKFSKQVQSAKKMVKDLQNEKCDIIICLSHSGVSKDKSGNWAGEDVELAQKVKGINIIVSGHTHTKLEKPLIVNGIPVVQTGEYGQFVGKLTVTLNNGSVKVDDYSLIPVDDRTMGDTEVNSIIEDQKKAVNAEILSPLGMDYDRPVAETEFLLECNEQGDFKGSNLGPLVADAIQEYVNNHNTGGTDISMVAVGVIRDKIVPGFQTAPDIFRIMSMGSGSDKVPGYPLARVYVTGKELKSILEILQVAYKSAAENYCFYSGLRVEYNPEKGMLKKIKKIELVRSDGTTTDVDFSKKNKKLYSITANSYMLEFVGIIKKMSFGLINVVPKSSAGVAVKNMKDAIIDFDLARDGIQEGKEWLALIEYISAMKDTNRNGIPDIDRKYQVPVVNFITVK